LIYWAFHFWHLFGYFFHSSHFLAEFFIHVAGFLI
jgi:hypothetical protein